MHRSPKSSQSHRGNQRIMYVHSSLLLAENYRHCNHITENQCINTEHVRTYGSTEYCKYLYTYRTGLLSFKEGRSCIHTCIWFKKLIKTTALFSKLLGLCFSKIFISLQCRHTLFLSIHQCHILSLLALSQTVLPHRKDSPLMRLCLR